MEAVQQRSTLDLGKLKEAKDLAEDAMELLRNCYRSYQEAADCEETRRLWSRAFFKRLAVSGRQVAKVEYAECERRSNTHPLTAVQ